MAKGRKKIDPSKKLVKTGFTITPQMFDDLEMLARFTNSSRSAVLVALLEHYMHDVVFSFREAAYLAKTEPERGLVLDAIALDFLKRVSVSHHGVEGFAFISFPPDVGGDA